MVTSSTTTQRVIKSTGKKAKILLSGLRAKSSAIRVCVPLPFYSYRSDHSLDLTPLADTKQTRVVKRTVPTESFFNFFSPPEATGGDEEDDEASTELEERLELDYHLGEDIKEKLIPRAVDWYTGEALQFEELEDDMDNEEFDDDEDDDDELSEDKDDDDEESEDEVTPNYYLLF